MTSILFVHQIVTFLLVREARSRAKLTPPQQARKLTTSSQAHNKLTSEQAASEPSHQEGRPGENVLPSPAKLASFFDQPSI